MGREHHDDRIGPLALPDDLANLASAIPSVHAGHLPVHINKRIGKHPLRLSLPNPDHFHGLRTTRGQINRPAPGTHHLLRQLASHRVVVHHQNRARCQSRRRPGNQLRRNVQHHRQGQHKRKGAALVQRTGDLDVPAHQFDQHFADRQPQARATKAAGCRRFSLGEACEHMGLLFRSDPDAGIFDRKLNGDPIRGCLQPAQNHHHLAMRGELDGVTAQVDQNLLQPHGIAQQHVGQGGINIKQNLNVFAAHIRGQHHRQMAQQMVQTKRQFFQAHFVGIGFREVENIVKQAQKRLGRALCLIGIVALAQVQFGGLQETEHAENRVHGGPDFVAHIGQKLTLCNVGGFSGIPRCRKFVLQVRTNGERDRNGQPDIEQNGPHIRRNEQGAGGRPVVHNRHAIE